MALFDRLKGDAVAEWQAYVEHPFVHGLGDGSLPQACFRRYLVQDYLFLIQFARAYALGVYKAPSLDDMRRCQSGLAAILDVEMDLHVRLCAEWGLSLADLEGTPEAPQTVAYTRFVLESGMRGDLLDLLTGLSPCVIGYAEIGKALADRQSLAPDNIYRHWIAEYSGAPYQEVAAAASAHLDQLAAEWLTEARYPRLLALFREATRLEADFWQMGLAAVD